MMSLPYQILLSLLVVLCLRFLHKLYKWQLRLHTFRRNGMPAIPVLVTPFSPLRRLLPKSFQTFTFDWSLQARHTIYKALGSDIFVLVSLFDSDEIQVCDPHLFAEIKTQWERYPKDVERMKAVALFGNNVLTAEGKVWRMQRKITARAFSPRTVQLVHAETVRQTNEMIKSLQRKYTDNEIEMEEYSHLKEGGDGSVHWNALKITLHVFFAAGLGHPFDWERSDQPWDGHTLSPVEAISAVVDNVLGYLFIPAPVRKLPFPYFKKLATAYDEAGRYYRQFIQLEKEGHLKNVEGRTVLGQLVSNSMDEDGGDDDGDTLTDEEIVGNIFIFITAGYESSANALMFCIYLLAIYPSVQDQLFTELQSVCGDQPPTPAHMPDLIYTTCILYETMRLFPLGAFLGQRVDKDQILQAKPVSPEDDLKKYFIPAGTAIALDLSNTERNPNYWDNPDEFIPSRFDARINPKDEYVEGKFKFPVKGAFIGFGDGPRACLGRKFAEMEIIGCLAVMAQGWTFHLKEGWTKKMAWEVLNSSTQFTTIRPQRNIPIVLRRR